MARAAFWSRVTRAAPGIAIPVRGSPPSAKVTMFSRVDSSQMADSTGAASSGDRIGSRRTSCDYAMKGSNAGIVTEAPNEA
jgi:hypothetical protein